MTGSGPQARRGLESLGIDRPFAFPGRRAAASRASLRGDRGPAHGTSGNMASNPRVKAAGPGHGRVQRTRFRRTTVLVTARAIGQLATRTALSISTQSR